MMRSVGAIILLTLMMEVSAELKVWPLRQVQLDNTTLGMLAYRFSKGLQVPQKFMNAPLHSRMPQASLNPRHGWMPSWEPQVSARAAAAAAAARFVARAEAQAETEGTATQAAKPVEGGALNVFGEQLQGCGDEGDMCNYPAELCVRTGKLTMRYQCKSIWNADWKSIKTVGGKMRQEQGPQAGDTTKCDAVPSEVLDSQYSKDEWGNLEQKSKLPTFLASGGKEGVRISDKATRFRKSIDFICLTCALYAESESAKSALLSKCNGIGWTDEVGAFASDSGSSAEAFAQTPLSIFSSVAVALIGILVGSSIALIVFGFRRGAAIAAKA